MSHESNDQRILELKKQIEKKKEQLGKSLKFTPLTNCSIGVDGERYNIQVLTKEQLIVLMVKLNAYRMSAKELDVVVKISGYPVEEWILDIKAKIEILSRKDEEINLKVMEDKLLKLLSEGKKVELELNEIESMIK